MFTNLAIELGHHYVGINYHGYLFIHWRDLGPTI